MAHNPAAKMDALNEKFSALKPMSAMIETHVHARGILPFGIYKMKEQIKFDLLLIGKRPP